ncbi:hypothetical protein SB581_01050 [Acinetobacter baumannii]|nr:hypothetical protein SB581_01050 [Acinetobacter baumannii]
MSNQAEKERIIHNTFDEMIARWSVSGFYHEKIVEKEWMTDLTKLRKLEIFLNNIERLKTDLFISGPSYHRNVYVVDLKEDPTIIFYPTQYAKESSVMECVFGPLNYLSIFENYLVQEISPKIFIFFNENDSNFGQVIKTKNQYELRKPVQKKLDDKVDIKTKFLRETSIQTLQESFQLDHEVIIFLNKKVAAYKEKVANLKSKKNLESKFHKKRKEFQLYFNELLAKHKKLCVFSINFYLNGASGKFNFPEIRKEFFNTYRFNTNLKSIVGYMGTWEFDHKNDFYFRVVFFAEHKTSEEQKNIVDTIIYTWESFGFMKGMSPYSELKFTAMLSNIGESRASLKKPTCIISKNSHKLISDFSDTVINYTTLAEKYFFPAELQIFIFEHMQENKKKKNEKGMYVIENLQYSFSRSFRGHIRKSDAEKLTLANPSKEDIRDSG